MIATYRKYRLIAAYIVVALLGIVIVYKAGNTFFQIKHIEVEGSGIQIQVNQQKIAKNLLFFPSETVAEEIMKQNPLVDHIVLQKKYPHTLIILASPRTPVARVMSQGIEWLIDKTNMILGPDNDVTQIPFIRISIPSVQIGRQVEDIRVKASVSFLNHVEPFLDIDTIEEFNSQWLVAKTKKTDILFPQSKDQRVVADTLQRVLSGFRIKGTIPRRIDMRFEKPAVVF